MSKEEILKEITTGILEFNIDGIKDLIKRGMAAGISPYEILTEGMAKDLDIVGKKYEEREYFLTELIMTGETMKTGMEVLAPYLKVGDTKRAGTVVIGTVKGDLHDIGKNIVVTLLSASGFEVHDLGIDVSAEKFVEKVKETKADTIALSALLTTTMIEMENIIKVLEREGIRNKVKVIVGGAPLSGKFAKKIGADTFAPDAIKGVEILKKYWHSARARARARL